VPAPPAPEDVVHRIGRIDSSGRIADRTVTTAFGWTITLPIGAEPHAAYALRAWLATDPWISTRTRRFASCSGLETQLRRLRNLRPDHHARR
jgi:hypothetical protein